MIRFEVLSWRAWSIKENYSDHFAYWSKMYHISNIFLWNSDLLSDSQRWF